MNRVFQSMEAVGKAAVGILVVATMLGCLSTNSTEEKWLSFRCPDGRTVLAQFEPKDEYVHVRFDGGELRLPHVISASGARYSDGKTTFWNKGRSALVEINDKIVMQDCAVQEER
jgi:membrane-bound inhibitor of C-type lysozyme